MKVKLDIKLDRREWYPIWTIEEDGWAAEIKLSEEEVARIKAANIEFDACQELIMSRMKKD